MISSVGFEREARCRSLGRSSAAYSPSSPIGWTRLFQNRIGNEHSSIQSMPRVKLTHSDQVARQGTPHTLAYKPTIDLRPENAPCHCPLCREFLS
jgi:hypothetical protein